MDTAFNISLIWKCFLTNHIVKSHNSTQGGF